MPPYVIRTSLMFALLLITGACRDAKPVKQKIERATLVITNVRVFDGEKLLPRADVVVDRDKIVAVGPAFELPAGVAVVDGERKTLLPGLIDAHVHVWDGSQLEQSLAFGVTTVLDMFTSTDLVKELKSENRPDRADLRSAGTLATAPGGHGTEYGFPIPTLTTPEEAQPFVDARFAEGSDYLKIVFDDGRAYGIKIPTVTVPTLRALIDAAHLRSKLAVVHIGSYEEARSALGAGPDGIVHLFRDAMPADDFGTFVAGTHAFVTPTLTVLNTMRGQKTEILDDPAIAPYLGPLGKSQLAAAFPFTAKTVPGSAEKAIALLRDAKVSILCGTDAPNAGTTHGASVHDELALLVKAGLSPAAALASATSVPADRFALTDRGRISAGLRADLVLVEGDPTTTITDTRRIVGIWRGGVPYDRAGYKARMAEAFRPVTIGPISDFEDGTIKTRFGQPWEVSTDSIVGGKSTAKLTVVDGVGASKHAMTIEGEVIAGAAGNWAGAMFSPGAQAFAAIDLSAKKQLSFLAKGDGKPYLVMVFTKRGGYAPATKEFQPGKDLARVSFSWNDFDNSDGKDVTGIFIGQGGPGKFSLVVDDVVLE